MADQKVQWRTTSVTVAFVLTVSCVSIVRAPDQPTRSQAAGVAAAGSEGVDLSLLLDSAYTSGSFELRHLFFEQWLRESNQLSASRTVPEEIADDLDDLFKLVYRPDSISFEERLDILLTDPTRKIHYGVTDAEVAYSFTRRSLWGPRDVGFLVVQPFMVYRCQARDDTSDICSTADGWKVEDAKWEVEDSVEFYPKVRWYDKPILYLTPRYHEALTSYLSLQRNGTKSKDLTSDLRRKKAEFIATEIPMDRLSGYSEYMATPTVHEIDFNSDTTKSRIRYTWGARLVDACFEKLGSTWTFKSQISVFTRCY